MCNCFFLDKLFNYAAEISAIWPQRRERKVKFQKWTTYMCSVPGHSFHYSNNNFCLHNDIQNLSIPWPHIQILLKGTVESDFGTLLLVLIDTVASIDLGPVAAA